MRFFIQALLLLQLSEIILSCSVGRSAPSITLASNGAFPSTEKYSLSEVEAHASNAKSSVKML
jgi:hypothetical protein